jgi:acetyl esterase
MKKLLKRTLLVILLLVIVTVLAFQLSPYPSVWIIRYGFDKEARRANKELAAFVPEGIEAISNIQYAQKDEDAYFDAYYHKDTVTLRKKLPVIVWTHGGGLISGNKEQLSNYCKLLASKGYLAISIDYSIAPKGKFPAPLQQLNKALAFITANSDSLHADSSFFVLAGDSGGSMIAASVANIITNPSYAALINIQPGINAGQLKGLLLHCGIYDAGNLNTSGSFGSFLKTVQWAYFGKKDISNDTYAKTSSVLEYVSSSFPSSFISAGNADPLLAQSQLLAQKLQAMGVYTDTLFYPKDKQPPLAHEYQFTMNESGKLALDRSLAFLKTFRTE